MSALGTTPGDRSDRALWQADADDVGHALLFASLWERADVLFLTSEVITGLPAGPLLFAEREALEDLLTFSRIDPSKQSEALARLRRIIHDNLITFDPTNEIELDYSGQTPRVRIRADVANALASCRTPAGSNLPFEVVDRTFLSKQREAPRRHFVARQPDWADVAHGADDVVKFVERSVTAEMRTRIIADLVEPLERGTDQRLHMLFVTGAPGSGKTTLVRRIACMLVDEGRIVVADAGVDVREPVGSPDDYAASLETLANAGRPVIFLLDDPLYGDSPWIQVLRRLNRPGLGISILAPCPQLLFERHRGSLSSGVLNHYTIGAPTEVERIEMQRLYGRTSDVLSNSDDFLVITMEAAAGIPFDEIMRRLWTTLNDGKPIVEDDKLDWTSLAWPVRAFTIVCYFHRAGVTCPELIIRAVLEREAADASPSLVASALARLRAQEGWKIFQLTEPLRNWAHQGTQVATAHQRIALRAWEVRPLKWFDVGYKLIRASLVVTQTAKIVGQLASRLRGFEDNVDQSFADRLVDDWSTYGGISEIETRHLCDLVVGLRTNGENAVGSRLAPLLRVRADAGRDGWLAALQLCYLAHEDQAPPSTNLMDLEGAIQRADFSIAPNRAIQFFLLLPDTLKPVFTSRILAGFDGELDWKPDSSLIDWLLGYGSPEGMLKRINAIEAWLDGHPQDAHVRTGYLSLLSSCRLTKNQLRRVMEDTELWLALHQDDTHTRTGYLSLLSRQKLNSDQLASVMVKTETWLDNHSEDISTRTGYLAFLSSQKLNTAELTRVIVNTEKWLDDHLEDTNTRSSYFGLLSKQNLSREELSRIKKRTDDWLNEHPNDSNVRNGFSTFLRSQHWFGAHPAETPLAARWPNDVN